MERILATRPGVTGHDCPPESIRTSVRGWDLQIPAGVPVVASTRPHALGAWLIDLGDAPTARAIQRAAVAAHASQSAILPGLLRRVAMPDGHEAVRWVLFPLSFPAQRERETPAAVWWG